MTKNSLRIQEKLLIVTVPDFLRLPHRYLSIYSNGTLPGLKFLGTECIKIAGTEFLERIV